MRVPGIASLSPGYGRLPQSHHAPLGIGEERERTHAGHFLLLDVDLASCLDDALAIRGKVVDRDVEGHVARPGAFALRLQDATVDSTFAAGLDDPVVQFGSVLNLPAENLLIKSRYLRRILRHHFPVNDGAAHVISFAD